MKISLKKKIEKIAKNRFKTAISSHDWDHVKRVYNLALKLGRKEKADLWVIKVAALLHDIKRSEEMLNGRKFCHAVEGAKEAEKILGQLGFEGDFIKVVKHCIEAHRFRNDIKPRTIEAKVLSDADKIDALGAIGIGRAFLYAGKIGARLHNSEIKNVLSTKLHSREDTFYREFMFKLRYLKNKMYTSAGKKMAKERTIFMENFLKRLDKEISAKL